MSDILTGTNIAPRRQTFWDLRAAGNFIGGGTGTGLLVVAAVALFYGGVPYTVPGLAGLALVAAGLGLVWLEIGKPWRALHVFFHPGTSWMTREAMAAPPLFAAGLLAAGLGDPWLALATALIALLFLTCQGRILTAAKGIPAWRQPLVLPLVLVTGIAEGAGLFLVLAFLLGGIPPWGAPPLLVLLAARAAVWVAYRKALARGGAPAAALRALARADRPLVWLGHALPALLLVLGLVAGDSVFEGALLAAAGLLVLAGGWFLKLVLVTRAAYNQGFAIPHAPARGKGGAGAGGRPGWS